MFRVGVASLVFVASFHPPVQSQWFHKADHPPVLKTAELTRFEIAHAGHPQELTRNSSGGDSTAARP
jgi:hypothetical protein